MAGNRNEQYDVIIIGSGPNGLSAGIYLAQKGKKVLILEAASSAGGGTRTAELTLPGFHHDVCSSVHPMGILSPFFKTLNLERFGLEWIYPNASVAHPLDNGEVIMLKTSVEETAQQLGADSRKYNRIMTPLAKHTDWLMEDSMKPLGIPKHPLFLAQFGLRGLLPAKTLGKMAFKTPEAKALFAGCAAHSIIPFEKMFSSAVGLVFLATGHSINWPVAKGGSKSIAEALLKCFTSLGGDIRFSSRITKMSDLPKAKAYLFDTDPLQLVKIAENELPKKYIKRVKKYNFGPGVFKIDYALSGPIPWANPKCNEASTVHLGGTLEEIAQGEKDVWEGRHNNKPFVLLTQQSLFDSERSPEGQHTCWAYCHVPNGSEKDMSEIIENQIERFAPGFKKLIIAKHSMNTKAFHAYNPNYVGGAVTGGAADITQLFTRPIARFDPYSTPNPKLFICSASTPPGGGVHGMNGYHAAKSVLKYLKS